MSDHVDNKNITKDEKYVEYNLNEHLKEYENNLHNQQHEKYDRKDDHWYKECIRVNQLPSKQN